MCTRMGHCSARASLEPCHIYRSIALLQGADRVLSYLLHDLPSRENDVRGAMGPVDKLSRRENKSAYILGVDDLLERRYCTDCKVYNEF